MRYQPVPLSNELAAATATEVRLTEKLLAGARLDEGLVRRLYGVLACRREALKEALAKSGILLATEHSRRGGKRQRVEIDFASLKRKLRLGETLASTLVRQATRIAAKIAAFTKASISTGCWDSLKVA